MSDRRQASGGDAPATGTVGVATELTRGNDLLEVGQHARGGLRENAFIWRIRRGGIRLDQAFRHRELGKLGPKIHQLCYDLQPVGRRQPLCRDLTDLRRVQADHDLPHGGLAGPEPDELFQVAGSADLLPRHRAVHDDLMPKDVLEDAILRCWFPTLIVLGL